MSTTTTTPIVTPLRTSSSEYAHRCVPSRAPSNATMETSNLAIRSDIPEWDPVIVHQPCEPTASGRSGA